MSNDSTEKVCQVCGAALSLRSLVYCAKCNTPHHEDCWHYTQCCSTFGCGCSQCHHSSSADDSSVKVMEINESGEGWLGGQKVILTGSPQLRMSLTNSNVARASVRGVRNHDVTEEYSRLDLNITLEQFLTFSAVAMMGIATAVASTSEGPVDWILIRYFTGSALFLMFVRMFVDCTYVLDNTRSLLLYSRSIFGITRTWKICEFSEVCSDAFVQ